MGSFLRQFGARLIKSNKKTKKAKKPTASLGLDLGIITDASTHRRRQGELLPLWIHAPTMDPATMAMDPTTTPRCGSSHHEQI